MRNDELLRNLLRNYRKHPTDDNAHRFAQASLRSFSGPLGPEITKLETVAIVSFSDLIRTAVLDGVKFKHLTRRNINQEFSWDIDDDLIAADNMGTEYGLLLEWVIHNQSCVELSHVSIEEDNFGRTVTVPGIGLFFIGTDREYSDYFSIEQPCNSDGAYVLNLHQEELDRHSNAAHQPFKDWINTYLKTLKEQGIEWLAVQYNYDV